MIEILYSIEFLTILFFIVALAYSIVGMGGGSSYTAIMVIVGFSSLIIPAISLLLNLIVTSIGSYNFIRNGYLRRRLILPFIITSIPMAWLGGSLQVSEQIFQWLLFISLLIVIFRIYFWKNTSLKIQLSNSNKIIISCIAGATLGLLAGIVGIGGGIYLVPLIIILGMGDAKEAAACGAVFIWVNSAIGLISRIEYNSTDLTHYIPLIIAVIIGGSLGSLLGATKLNTNVMEKTLGGVVVVAVIFLGRHLLFP